MPEESADVLARLEEAEARLLIMRGAMLGVLEYVNPTVQIAARRMARTYAVTTVAAKLGRPKALALHMELFPGPGPDDDEFILPPQ